MVSSVVERLPYKQVVTGSNPVLPNYYFKRRYNYSCIKTSRVVYNYAACFYDRLIGSLTLTKTKATTIAITTKPPARRLRIKEFKVGVIMYINIICIIRTKFLKVG